MTLSELQKQIPKSCKILAVSKGQPLEKILLLYKSGQKIFAENYVQEAVEKIDSLNLSEKNNAIQWHFIGRIQKNKLKDIVGKFSLIHSVDSFATAAAIQNLAEKKRVVQDILLQINLSGEDSKGGCEVRELPLLLKQLEPMSSIRVCGFMTMPPLSPDSESSRIYFRQLRELLEKFKVLNKKLSELSMGTSSDYLVAAQEGATLIRVGTLLFGERKK